MASKALTCLVKLPATGLTRRSLSVVAPANYAIRREFGSGTQATARTCLLNSSARELAKSAFKPISRVIPEFPTSFSSTRWSSNSSNSSWNSSCSHVLFASATAIAALTPSDEEKSSKHVLIPVSGADTREEGLLLASKQELEDSARGRSRENPSTLYIWYKNVVRWFYRICYNPVATCLRFLHLALLFGPVLITFPAVLVGPKVLSNMNRFDNIIEDDNTSSSRDRIGAIWWFKYLTWTMEMAGPSFIKVLHDDDFYCRAWLDYLSFVFLLSCYYGSLVDF